MIHRLLKIALLTGDETCGALFDVSMLARARVEDEKSMKWVHEALYALTDEPLAKSVFGRVFA